MSQENFEQLLHESERCGVYQLPRSGRMTLESAAKAADIDFAECDFDDSDDVHYALTAIAEALDFPEWFGANFDALHDCLTDLSWRESPATVLLLTACEELQANEPEAFATLLEVFGAATEFWRDEEVPFWVFVDLDADDIPLLPTAD